MPAKGLCGGPSNSAVVMGTPVMHTAHTGCLPLAHDDILAVNTESALHPASELVFQEHWKELVVTCSVATGCCCNPERQLLDHFYVSNGWFVGIEGQKDGGCGLLRCGAAAQASWQLQRREMEATGREGGWE